MIFALQFMIFRLTYINLKRNAQIISLSQIFAVPLQTMSENVILVDADYVDKVAFDLTVNFERMIGRRIPQADLARWVDCVALDGGLREGKNETQVVLIHDKESEELKFFVPGHFENDLNGKAFSDHLGEFVFEVYPVEPLTTKEDYFADVLQTVCQQQEVNRVMVVPGEGDLYNKVRETLNRLDECQKHITVFTMQPMMGGSFRQEILGYSLMAALGIRGEELRMED